MTKRPINDVTSAAEQDRLRRKFIDDLEIFKQNNSYEITSLFFLINQLVPKIKNKVISALREFCDFEEIDDHLIITNFLKTSNHSKEIFDFFEGFAKIELELKNERNNILNKGFSFKYNRDKQQTEVKHGIYKDNSGKIIIDFKENIFSSKSNSYQDFINDEYRRLLGDNEFAFKKNKLFDQLKDALIERKRLFDIRFYDDAHEKLINLVPDEGQEIINNSKNKIELRNLSALDENKLEEIFLVLNLIPNLELKLFEKNEYENDYSDKINELIKYENIVKLDLSSRNNKIAKSFSKIFKDIEKFEKLNISDTPIDTNENLFEIHELICKTKFNKIDISRARYEITGRDGSFLEDAILESEPREISINPERLNYNFYEILNLVQSPIKINLITGYNSFNNKVYRDLDILYKNCKNLEGYNQERFNNINKDFDSRLEVLVKSILNPVHYNKIEEYKKNILRNPNSIRHSYIDPKISKHRIKNIEELIDARNNKIFDLIKEIQEKDPIKFGQVVPKLDNLFSWDILKTNPNIEFTTNGCVNKTLKKNNELGNLISGALESLKDKEFSEQNKILKDLSDELVKSKTAKTSDTTFKDIHGIKEEELNDIKKFFLGRLEGQKITYKSDNYSFTRPYSSFNDDRRDESHSVAHNLHLCDLAYLYNYMMNIEQPRDIKDIKIAHNFSFPDELANEHELFRRKTELENGTYKAPIGTITRRLAQSELHNSR